MCKSILKGQNVPGTDGTYHGTDGTCPRDRRDAHQGGSRQSSLCLLVFFFPNSEEQDLDERQSGRALFSQARGPSPLFRLCPGPFGSFLLGPLNLQSKSDNFEITWKISKFPKTPRLKPGEQVISCDLTKNSPHSTFRTLGARWPGGLKHSSDHFSGHSSAQGPSALVTGHAKNFSLCISSRHGFLS